MSEDKIWQSWNDKDGYGYWDSKGEAEQYCDDDFDPVLFVPTSRRQDALLERIKELEQALDMALEAVEQHGTPLLNHEEEYAEAVAKLMEVRRD